MFTVDLGGLIIVARVPDMPGRPLPTGHPYGWPYPHVSAIAEGPMAHNCIWVRIHLVWSTKLRQQLIEPVWEDELYSFIAGVVKNKGGRMICAGGMSDHVHLYIALPARLALAKMVAAIKSNSSRWVSEHHPGETPFAWQRGYGAFSMNRKNERHLRSYIAGQKKHHARRTTVEEILGLATLHGMNPDPDILN